MAKQLTWLTLFQKLRKQPIKNMHDYITYIDKNGNPHILLLNFNKYGKPYFTDKNNTNNTDT